MNSNRRELHVGSISGTSIDGLDVALVDLTDQPRLIAGRTFGFPDDLAAGLRQLARTPQVSVDLLGRMDTWLGQFTAAAILTLLKDAGVDPSEVKAIGSHGQTIRHAPELDFPYTLQIGNPAVIAEHTRIDTIADLRRADLAAGGQAAPLVPGFHAQLFGHLGDCGVLNIGGIANLTVLRGPHVECGFDTGPGNTLLDAWCRQHGQGAFDRHGAWAASGTCDSDLLHRLLAEPWLAQPPPRSTGPELFNLDWLDAQLTGDEPPADVQATLLQLTVTTIADAIARHAPGIERLLVHGGGRHNRQLMAALARALSIPVETTDTHGCDGDQIESMTFAWLAHRALAGAPGNVPAVTGARGPRVLGSLYRAP